MLGRFQEQRGGQWGWWCWRRWRGGNEGPAAGEDRGEVRGNGASHIISPQRPGAGTLVLTLSVRGAAGGFGMGPAMHPNSSGSIWRQQEPRTPAERQVGGRCRNLGEMLVAWTWPPSQAPRLHPCPGRFFVVCFLQGRELWEVRSLPAISVHLQSVFLG